MQHIIKYHMLLYDSELLKNVKNLLWSQKTGLVSVGQNIAQPPNAVLFNQNQPQRYIQQPQYVQGQINQGQIRFVHQGQIPSNPPMQFPTQNPQIIHQQIIKTERVTNSPKSGQGHPNQIQHSNMTPNGLQNVNFNGSIHIEMKNPQAPNGMRTNPPQATTCRTQLNQNFSNNQENHKIPIQVRFLNLWNVVYFLKFLT